MWVGRCTIRSLFALRYCTAAYGMPMSHDSEISHKLCVSNSYRIFDIFFFEVLCFITLKTMMHSKLPGRIDFRSYRPKTSKVNEFLMLEKKN